MRLVVDACADFDSNGVPFDLMEVGNYHGRIMGTEDGKDLFRGFNMFYDRDLHSPYMMFFGKKRFFDNDEVILVYDEVGW